MTTILVTGTSGHLGRLVVESLLENGTSPGDIVATATLGQTGINTYSETDEYGNPAAGTTPTRYNWLGTHQRDTNTTGGLTLMGARLYNPRTGNFLTTDPIPGGNLTPYTYPQDPINGSDLTGTHAKWKNLTKSKKFKKSTKSKTLKKLKSLSTPNTPWYYQQTYVQITNWQEGRTTDSYNQLQYDWDMPVQIEGVSYRFIVHQVQWLRIWKGVTEYRYQTIVYQEWRTDWKVGLFFRNWRFTTVDTQQVYDSGYYYRSY